MSGVPRRIFLVTFPQWENQFLNLQNFKTDFLTIKTSLARKRAKNFPNFIGPNNFSNFFGPTCKVSSKSLGRKYAYSLLTHFQVHIIPKKKAISGRNRDRGAGGVRVRTPPLWGRRLRLLGRNDVQNTPPTNIPPVFGILIAHACILIN